MPYTLQMASPSEGNSGGVTVAGNVTGAYTPAPHEHLWAILAPVSDWLAPKPVMADITDMSFTFPSVTPGEYTLSLMDGLGNAMMACSMVCYGETVYTRDSRKVRVTASALTTLTLELHPLPRVIGELLIDGKPPMLGPESHWKDWTGWFVSSQSGQGPESAKLDEQGRFSFPALGTESYSFLFNYFWPDYAVRRITVDGSEVRPGNIRLSYGQTAHIVVDVTTATVTSRGTVHSTPSNPPVDPFRDPCANLIAARAYTALLIPDPVPPSTEIGIKEGREITSYSAVFNGILPGRYHVLAFENFFFSGQKMFRREDARGLLEDQNFVQALAALGKSVEIADGKPFDFDAPLITEQLQLLLAQFVVHIPNYLLFPR